MLFYTDQGLQIIYLSFIQTLWTTLLFSYIYEEDITVTDIAEKLFLMLMLFMLCSMLAMVILYISSLQHRMKQYNVANIKLLDCMHEGLLILAKSDKRIMFCNKPS